MLRILAGFMELSAFALNLTTGLGLGLGLARPSITACSWSSASHLTARSGPRRARGRFADPRFRTAGKHPPGRFSRRAHAVGRIGNVLIQVAPKQPPLSNSSQRLLHDTRQIHAPFHVGVAGQTASYVDLEHARSRTCPRCSRSW